MMLRKCGGPHVDLGLIRNGILRIVLLEFERKIKGGEAVYCTREEQTKK